MKDAKYIRNLIFTTVMGGLMGVMNYAFNVIVARYTDSSVFSTFSASMAFIYLLQIPSAAVILTVTKIVGENRKYDLERFKWRILLIFSVMGAISSALFFLFRTGFANIASIPLESIIYLAIILLISFISPISKGLLLGRERIYAYNIIVLAETILKLGMGIVAIKLGGSIPLLILSNCLPALLTTIVIYPLIRVKGEEKKEKIAINYKHFLLIAVSFLLMNMPYTLDLILVNPGFRADYSAVSLLGKIVYFAATTIASVMFARLANQTDPKAERKTMIIAILGTLFIGLGLTLGIFVLGDWVITWTIGEKYLSVAPYVGIFGLCMTGYAVVYMLANYFISINRYTYIYILLVVSALQVYLFKTYNGSLTQVLNNQIVVYGLLTVLTLGYLFIILAKKRNGQKEDKAR